MSHRGYLKSTVRGWNAGRGAENEIMEPQQQWGLAELRDGDHGALAALMRRYNRRLYRAARAVVRDPAEAEDIVQETYVCALARVEQCRDEAALGAWLLRIAVREALCRLRKERRRRELAAAGAPAPDAAPESPEREAYGSEMRSAIERAVDALPLRLRLAFVLRAIDGVSTTRTAALLGISPAAVKLRVFRARAALRRALGPSAATEGDDVFAFGGARCARLAGEVLRRIGGAEVGLPR